MPPKSKVSLVMWTLKRVKVTMIKKHHFNQKQLSSAATMSPNMDSDSC